MARSLFVLLIFAAVCWWRLGVIEPQETCQPEAPVDNAIAPVAEGNARLGDEILGPDLGEFIFISGGEFTMGRDTGECEDQRPEHLVELSPFSIGRTPVTNAQFVRFLNEAHVKQSEYLCSQICWAKPSVTFVEGSWTCAQGTEKDAASGESWILAGRYCDWLSATAGRKCRLPTEAEWEYVCRGKEGRKFPWGNTEDELESRVWHWRTWRSSKPNMVPVGSFPKGATPEGVCDLVGYMDEMCSDWYDPEYYAKSPRTNPQGPSEPLRTERFGDAKVMRGGFEHHYSSEGISGFFRRSQFFGVLPSSFLPRGWSRDYLSQQASPPKTPHEVSLRLGFRVVVESEK